MKTFKEFNYPEQYFREGWFDKDLNKVNVDKAIGHD